MKTIVIIFAICVCVGALTLEELKIGLRATLPICKIETGIDEQKENNIRDGIVDVEDEQVQLYSECLIKKFNAYDDDGKLNEVVVREIARLYFDEDDVNKIITDCSSISDTNMHLKSSKLIACFGKYTTLNKILNN
ncbi:LOW QUALITY PROTEIN: uncharacterized protein LOC100871543 [Apis florea]|uniref:LOW QUALITY PROTEIN: uncharacterized protein LOC100871543 n=1 Tax=Apis florea TaxID=7463 RepID=UPI0012FF2745|nr:LOW QUALITY PROTEIN: uncharacterized protein LOC100871543 [Apis florea]